MGHLPGLAPCCVLTLESRTVGVMLTQAVQRTELGRRTRPLSTSLLWAGPAGSALWAQHPPCGPHPAGRAVRAHRRRQHQSHAPHTAPSSLPRRLPPPETPARGRLDPCTPTPKPPGPPGQTAPARALGDTAQAPLTPCPSGHKSIAHTAGAQNG